MNKDKNKKRIISGSITSWICKRQKADTNTTQIKVPDLNESHEISNNLRSLPVQNIPSSSNVCKDISTDFGDYLDGTKLDDYNKARLLELTNIPDDNFIYPFSIHNKKGKEERRFIKRVHFESFKWLVYSIKAGGVFCKNCILFAHKGGKDKNIPLKMLVTIPLTKYAKLLGKDGDLVKHNQNLYHINAVSTSTNFLTSYKNPEKKIINIVNTSRMKQVAENRLRLKPIIETVIFCGRQNIPLRGHRDQGKLLSVSPKDCSSVINEGNFRELLRYRISAGDTVLENHLQTTSSKATYISHTTQEEIINCCKDEITFNIVQNVKASKYYAIIFDETTDVSHISQMSLILRNVDIENKVHERFICFIDCHNNVYEKNNINEYLNNIQPYSEHIMIIIIINW